MYGANKSRTGKIDDGQIPSTRPAILWQSNDKYQNNSIVAFDDLVFATHNIDRVPEYPSSEVGEIHALTDTYSEKNWKPLIRKWKFECSSNLYAPIVNKSIICSGSEEYIYAIDKQTGEKIWNYENNQNSQPKFCFIEGNIVVAVRDRLVLLDIETGSEIWGFSAEDHIKGIAVNSGNILIPDESGKLNCLNTAGELQWAFELSGEPKTPCICDSTVFAISSRGFLHSIRLNEGVENWRAEIDAIPQIPTIANGLLYICTFKKRDPRGLNSTYNITCIDISDGSVRWENEVGRAAKPVCSGGDVLIASYEGTLHSFHSDNGMKNWELQLPGTTLSSPVVNDGSVLIPVENQLTVLR
jgi:outer membrane protein assembly factor BamB